MSSALNGFQSLAAEIPGMPPELMSWLVALAAAVICIDRLARMVTAPHFITFVGQLRKTAISFSKWMEVNLRHPDHSQPSRAALVFIGFTFTLLCYLFVGMLLAQSSLVVIGLVTKQVSLVVFVAALLLLLVQIGGAQYYRIQAYREREKLRAITAGTWLGKPIF